MPINTNNSGDSSFPVIKLGLFVVFIVVALLMSFGAVGHNDNHDWQVVQYPNGHLEVIDSGGYYMKWWGSVWTYPKYLQLDYTEEKTERYPNDESVAVTFNDGGNANSFSGFTYTKANNYVYIQGNLSAANVSATLLTGTLTTAAQPNITSVGTLTTLSSFGNANVGNLGSAGVVTATGNVTGEIGRAHV